MKDVFSRVGDVRLSGAGILYMTTVAEHYENHPVPVYLWMAGGFDAAVSRGDSEVDAMCANPTEGLTAVDLGAGFCMHSIPLARRRYSVIAIDSSPYLLEILRNRAKRMLVRMVEADLLAFQKYLDTKVNLILCMGDTLTYPS